MWFSFISSFFCMIVKGCSVSVLTFLFRESQILEVQLYFQFLTCQTFISYSVSHLLMSFIVYLARRWALDRNFFFFFYFDKIIPYYLESGGKKHKSQREIGKSLSNSLFKAKKPFLHSEQTKKSSKKSSGLSVRSLHLLASVVILNFLKKASY